MIIVNVENLDKHLISTISTPLPLLGVEIKSMYTVLKNVYFIRMNLENTGGGGGTEVKVVGE